MQRANSHPESQKKLLHDSIRDIHSPGVDFTSKYFAVNYLQLIARSDPDIITTETIRTLESLLLSKRYARERRGFFLFRLAAETLITIMVHLKGRRSGERAYIALLKALNRTTGHAHRVSAEALGTLPFRIRSPEIQKVRSSPVIKLSWSRFLDELGNPTILAMKYIGRSLIIDTGLDDQIMVLKFARLEESFDSLLAEALWMEAIQHTAGRFPIRFDIPSPFKISKFTQY